MLRQWRDQFPTLSAVRLRIGAVLTVLAVVVSGLVFVPIATAAVANPTLGTPTMTVDSMSIPITAQASGAVNYSYQITTPSGYSVVTPSPATTASPIVISNLTANTAYTVKVKTIDGTGTSSNGVSASGTTPPTAPTGLSVSSVTSSTAVVAFTAAGTATTNIQYSLNGGAFVAASPAVTSSPITISGLTANTSYSIALKVVNSAGTSDASSAVSTTTGPAAPTAATAAVVNGDSTRLTATFTAPSFGSYGLSRYEYSIDSGVTWVTAAQSSSPITVTGLTANTPYALQLRAVTTGGTGSAVTLASVTTLLAAPTALAISVAATASTVSISFTKPTGTVTNYEYSLDDGATWTLRSPIATTSPIALSGLSANTTYQIRLRAVSAAGSGSPSAALAVTTTTPSAPSGTTATGVTGDGTKLSVSFTPASGNAAVTRYEYTSNGGSTFATATGTTSPIQIPGLTANTVYSGYAIRVITAGGTSAWSTPTFGGTTVPGAPTSPVASVVAGNANRLSVAFTAPSGAATITGYEFSTDGGTNWSAATGSSSPITLTGLSGGTAYTTLQIRARNAGGSGTATANFAGTTLLAAPTGMVASGVSADGTKLSVAFTAPTGTVTSYQYSTDGGTNWVTAVQTSSPLTITGLTANTLYSNIVIRGINGTGNGATSAVFSGTTVPGAPLITGVSGSTTSSFTVAFNAPSGAVTITGYEYSIDAGTTWTALTSGEATARSFTISGLTSNQVYSVRLRAINASGTGTYDTAAGTTVSGVVGSLSVAAVSGDGTRLTTSFTAPSGNAVVSSYAYSLDGTNWNSFTPSLSNGVLSYTITGLSPNTSYAVQIAAVNFVGRGSDTSASATTALDAPSSIVASGVDGDGTVLSVAFINPSGSASITGYQYSLDGGTNWVTAVQTSSPISVTGLAAGTSYSGLKMRVLAGATAGSSASFDGVTTGNAPTITGVSAITNTSVSVSFTLPSATGTATNVQYSTDGGTTWSTRSPSSVTSPLVIAGLAGNTSYDIKLRSVNAGGLSGASSTSTTLTTPDAPTGASASSVNGASTTLSVAFAAPTGLGTVTGYEFSTNGGTSWSAATGTSTPITLTGLAGNTSYDSLKIRAVNVSGSGAASSSFSGVTVPGAVTVNSVVGVDGDGSSLTVSFTAPTGTESITGYEYSLSADGEWIAATASSSPITITGLTTNSAFSALRVRATNAAGAGDAVLTSGTTTPGAPSDPVASGVDGSSGSLSVAFTAPSGTGTITSYQFSTDGGTSWSNATGASSPITLTGLDSNTAYSGLVLRARTSGGAGTASVPFDGTTVAAAPTAVTVAGVDGTPTELSVSFTAPTGSGSVTDYEYSIDGGTNWTSAGATSSPITVTGLSANTAYTQLRVRAVTAAGKGASTANKSGTTAPGAPTSLVASGVSGDATKLSVAFTAPTGDASITRYEFSLDGGTTWASATGTSSPVVLAGLTGHTTYTGILLRAVNAAGLGVASAGFDGTTTMSAPTSPVASPVDGVSTSLTVAFTAPSGTISGYEFSTDGGSTWATATGAESPITIAGLSGNTAYTQLAIRAVDGSTAGAASVTFSGTTVAAAPGALVVTGVDGDASKVSVTFTVPTGAATITGYEYAIGSNGWVALTTDEATARSFQIGGLAADTEYTIALRALNAGGNGTSGTASGYTVPAAPSSPLAVGLSGASGLLDVTFTPTADDDASISGYQYRVDTGSWVTLTSAQVTAAAFSITGVSANTEHTLDLRARNSGGGGEYSSTTGTTVPSAPVIGSVHSHTVNSFDVPYTAVTGAASIVRYEYSVDNSESWTTLSETEVTDSVVTVVGLSANTVHSVRLRAVNSSGNGVTATTSATTLAAAPVVSSTSGVAADGTKLTVSFSAPVGGGATITGYEFSTNGGSSWSAATGTSSPITLTGLTANTSYSALRIRAVNAGGSGTSSDEFAGATTAGPPTITSYTNATSTSFDLNFTAPTGDAITSYEYYLGGSWVPVAQTTSPISISGLAGNTRYFIKVRAITNGVAGVASSEVVGTTVPAAPTSLSAAAVTGSATTLTVTLTAPTGDATITGYEFKVDGQSSWSAATGTASPITLTGLAANTAYSSLQVRAVNAAGSGVASDAFAGTTAPGAPTNMEATAVTGDPTRLQVSFTAPTGGGVAITGYEYRLNGAASWTSAATLSATSIEISGLTANTTYASLAIRALNASGMGVTSATFSGTTVVAAPTVPVASAVTGNTSTLTVAFTAPTGTITSYEFSTDGGSTWAAATGASSPITLTGLTANTAYAALRIRAVGAAGSGASTASFSGTTVPSAPSISSITAASTTALTVNFDAPTSPQSTSPASLTNYEYSVNGGSTWTPRTTTGTASPITITGLTANTSYSVKIRAVNAGGSGVGSSTVTGLTLSDAPTAMVAAGVTGDGTKLAVTFTAPSGAGTITKYQYSTDGTNWTDATGTASPITLSGLASNTAYTNSLRIRAVSSAGNGSTSATFSGTTVPGAPTITSIVGATTTSITVNITAPTGAVAITGYQFSTNGGSTWAAGTVTSGAMTISTLVSNTDYNVQVRALSAAGTGAASTTTVGAPWPGTPTVYSATPFSGDGTKLNIAFTPPSGTSALQYQYSIDNKATWYPTLYTATISGSTASMVITGLTPSTAYANLNIRAVNANGSGAGTGRFTSVTTTVAAPTALALAAVSGNGTQLTATFTAPAGTITNYEWSTDGGTTWVTPTVDTTSPITITGLTANTTYSDVRVRAVTSLGSGSASTGASGTTTAGAPTGMSASAVSGDGTKLSVAFTAPSGSATVVKYQYTTNATWVDATGTTSPITLTGLTAGTAYSALKIRVVTAAGNGTESAVFSGTTVPSAPTALSQTAATTSSVTVAFTAPTGTITSYQYSLDGTTWTTATQTASPITITGLTSNNSFDVLLRAVSAAGTGAATASAFTATTAPEAPVVSSATGVTGDGTKLSVAFTQAQGARILAGVRAATITGYQYSTNGSTWVAATGTSSPITLTGLTANTKYLSLQIRATNAGGTSAASTAFAGTTVPGAPTITGFSAATNTSFDVNFTAPSGAASIAAYQYSTDGGTTWTTAGGSTSPISVTGLAANTSYLVQVRASNDGGIGVATSSVSGTTTPAAPTNVSLAAVVGDGTQATATFTAPTGGGATIISYSFSLDGGTTWTTASGTSSPITLSGLTANSDNTQVKIRANNAGGSGVASDMGSVFTTPGAPSSVSITGVASDTTRLSVAFTAPTGTGTITSYQYSTNGGTNWTTATETSSPVVITGLATNTLYSQITLRAVSAVGAGSKIVNSNGTTLQAAPTLGALSSVTTTGFSIAFTAAAAGGGATITNYQYSLDGGTTWLTRSPAATTTPLVITGLSANSAYNLQLRAVNAGGGGVASSTKVSTTLPEVPTGMVATGVTGDGTKLSVSFTTPSGNATITGYEFTTNTAYVAATGTSSPITLTGLTVNTTYTTLKIRAINAGGTGAATAVFSGTTVLAAPTAISQTAATTSSVTLAFTKPTGTVTGYQYSFDGTNWTTAAQITSPITITGLTSNSGYDVVLRALSAGGSGVTSSTFTATTVPGPPLSPVATTVDGDGSKLSVSFTAPTSATGVGIRAATVTGYQYSIDGTTWTNATGTSSPIVLPSLTPNTKYTTLRLRATNVGGTGTTSALFEGQTSLGAPTITGITAPSTTALDVAFTPAVSGADTITNYQYSLDGGTTWITRSPESTVSPIQLTALAWETSYNVQVRAVSPTGIGSASATVVGVTPPTAPTGLVVSPYPGDATKLSVAFADPSPPSPHTKYEYRIDGGAWLTATGTTSPISIGGSLSPLTTYSVEIRAYNAGGVGEASSAASGTTGIDAPTIVAVTAVSTTSLSVDFTPPATGTVTNYQFSSDGGTTWTTRSSGTTASPLVITGLATNTTFNVKVRALDGGSVAGSASTSFAGTTMPGAPTITGITSSAAGSLSVAVTAPTGNATITNYEYSTDAGANWTTRSPASAASPIVISGLNGNTAYSVQVRAVNGAGVGTATASTTGTTVPGAPTITSIGTATATGFTVSITPPTGTPAITAYQYSVDGGTTWAAATVASNAFTLSTLTSNTAYDVKVKASNASGFGTASATAVGTTLPGKASIATFPGVDGDGTKATISVTTASIVGSATLTGFQYSLDNGSTWPNPTVYPATLSGANYVVVVGGLAANTSYANFTVRAVNAAGAGAGSGKKSVVTVPGQPTISSLTGLSSTSVRVAFTAPTGAVTLTNYEYSTDGVNWTARSAAAITSPWDITGLAANTTYNLRIRATNSGGKGESSAVSSITTTASAPTAVTASGVAGDSTKLSVAFTAPGGTVTSYQYSLNGGSSWTTASETSSPVVITGLTANTSYTTLQLRAVGGGGAGAATANFSGTTVTAAPTISATTLSETSIRLTVTAAPAGTITGYQYSLDNGNWSTAASSPLTVSGLTANTTYAVRVRAVNGSSLGGDAASLSATTTAGAPTIVGSPEATDSTMSVAFTAPSGTATITNYEYSTNGGTTWITRSPASTASPIAIASLAGNSTFTLQVRAVNAAGSGTSTSSVSVTTLPGAPTNVVASGVTRDSSKLSVSFTAPTGAVTITGYEYRLGPAAAWLTATSTSTTSIRISGLNADTLYDALQVRALNAAGNGVASAAFSGTTVHAAPTIGSLTRSNASVTLAYAAAASNGISDVTSYNIYAYTDIAGTLATGVTNPQSDTTVTECDTTIASCGYTFTGLSNGVTYYFRAAAVTANGEGDLSGYSSSATPATVPNAPVVGPPNPGNSIVEAHWVVPTFNGGATINGYRVYVYTDAAGSVLATGITNPVTVSGAATNRANITGLTNLTSYYYRVVAHNVEGDSAPSAVSVAAIPLPVADPPANVTGTPGNQQVTVSWTAPAYPGVSPLLSYKVFVYSDADTEHQVGETLIVTGSPLPTSKLVTGLTNGTPYWFEVVASNEQGDSMASTESAAATPRTVPDAPTSVTLTAGVSTVTVDWEAPAWNGGASITSYRIFTYSDAAATTQVGSAVVVSGSPLATEGDVTGLSAGVDYWFRVEAVNEAGASVKTAAATDGVAPFAVPSAPSLGSVESGNTTATVNWTALTPTVVRPVTGYRVYVYTDANATVLAAASGSLSNPQVFTGAATETGTITGLTNGVTYRFRVAAYNVAGESAKSVSGTTTPSTVADAPTVGVVSAGNTSVTVNWTAAASNGGAAISEFRVYVYTDSAGTELATGITNPQVFSGAATKQGVVTGLTNGTSYWFKVTAVNVKGESAASALSGSGLARTVADAPTSVTLTAGIAKVTVAWQAPTWNGGAAITSYRIFTYSDAATTTQVGQPVVVSGSPVPTTGVVSGLANGTDYWFRVEAVNEAGSSVKTAAEVDGVAPLAAPTAPTIGGPTSGNTTITVNWTALTATTARPVDGYRVYVYSDSNGSVLVPVVTGFDNPQVFSGASTNSGIVTGLVNGTRYYFRVAGYNEVAEGTKSSLSGATTPSTIPDAPTIGVVAAANASTTVNWTVPTWNGGAAITNFKVYVYTDVDGTTLATGLTNPQSFSGATTKTGVVTGLANGTTYWFKVAAVNVKGDSSASALSGSATARTVPDAPSIEVTSRGDRQLTFSLTAPSWNGGADITSYQYSTDGGTKWTTLTGSSPYTILNLSGTSTRLTNGTSYNVTARAVNVAGGGAASTASAGIPATIPGAPTAAVATRGNEQMSITWTAPASNGGDAISDYRVTAYAANGTSDATGVTGDLARLVGSDATSYTFTGLTNGTSYRFKIEAKNAMGWSLMSSASTAVVANADNPPLSLLTSPSAVGVLQDIDVTLTGTNLVEGATLTGDSKVTISNVVATNGQITFTMAGVTAGTSTLTIINPDHGVGWATVTVTPVLANLAVSSLPAALAQGATRSLSLSGTGLQVGATIDATTLPAGVTVSTTPTTVTNGAMTFGFAATSSVTLGDYTIGVNNPDGGYATFAFTINPPPTITKLSPSSLGPSASSVPIVLTGTNFFTSSDVVLVAPTTSYTGTVTLDRAQYVSNTQANLVVSVSADALYAKWTIRITNVDGGVATSDITIMPAMSAASTTIADPNHPEYTVDGALQLAKAPVAPATYTDYIGIKVSGVGIQKGATFSISGSGVLVGTPVYTFDEGTGIGTLTAKIRVQASATTGLRTVTVINPDKATVALVGAVRIA